MEAQDETSVLTTEIHDLPVLVNINYDEFFISYTILTGK